jgi:hypothetical protein
LGTFSVILSVICASIPRKFFYLKYQSDLDFRLQGANWHFRGRLQSKRLYKLHIISQVNFVQNALFLRNRLRFDGELYKQMKAIHVDDRLTNFYSWETAFTLTKAKHGCIETRWASSTRVAVFCWTSFDP